MLSLRAKSLEPRAKRLQSMIGNGWLQLTIGNGRLQSII